MTAKPTILIAGAGLGGLTAAIALAQSGFKVQVFEQAQQLGEIGAGVRIHPNGFRALAGLGLKEAILKDCYTPKCREIRVWNTGYCASAPFSVDAVVSRYGYPGIAMHRADLHAVLVNALEALQPGAVQVSSKVAGFEQTNDGVQLSLADGRRYKADVLVGADGLHSVIRKQLFGASKAEFTGTISWRGIIPVDSLPEGARTFCGQGWMGLNGHWVVYRIRRGELINIVGHIDRDDWQVESWTELGTTEEMQADFKGWHPHIQALIRNIDKPYKWALFLHPTMPQWTEGRVTLLGDACHPTLPYLGAGANMAIEDGVILARCLDRYDPITALKRYEELRIPRTTQIVNASAANRSRYHHPDLGDPDKARIHIDRIASNLNDSDAWVYGYDAATVPI
ncbi:FAD-dependent monooxygenase [Peristeroidobacter soli]|uniref:FAD-dependent monooxygenase n=1 Tax=Peristeroidobacter soli TaxID=2497877 RepID=UPI00101C3345|nr:FAD-dependent monooxygenase [Peristeroidobacter soli]